MDKRELKQVDILKMCKPFCEKYNIKLNKNDLSQYVSGKVLPSQNKLYILGLALNVSEPWLMGYDVPMDKDKLKESAEGDQTDELGMLRNKALDLFKQLDSQKQEEALRYIKYLVGSQDDQWLMKVGVYQRRVCVDKLS